MTALAIYLPPIRDQNHTNFTEKISVLLTVFQLKAATQKERKASLDGISQFLLNGDVHLSA